MRLEAISLTVVVVVKENVFDAVSASGTRHARAWRAAQHAHDVGRVGRPVHICFFHRRSCVYNIITIIVALGHDHEYRNRSAGALRKANVLFFGLTRVRHARGGVCMHRTK